MFRLTLLGVPDPFSSFPPTPPPRQPCCNRLERVQILAPIHGAVRCLAEYFSGANLGTVLKMVDVHVVIPLYAVTRNLSVDGLEPMDCWIFQSLVLPMFVPPIGGNVEVDGAPTGARRDGGTLFEDAEKPATIRPTSRLVVLAVVLGPTSRLLVLAVLRNLLVNLGRSISWLCGRWTAVCLRHSG